MESFVFHLPTKIIFGSGKLAEVGTEGKKLGKRALILTGKTAMRATGVLDKVVGALKAQGVEALIFDRVEPNPRVETLDQAVALGFNEGADFVIGLGGGSPMDSAKAVAATLGHAKRQNLKSGALPSVWEWTSGLGAQRRKVQGPLPTLLVSSSAATGSEGNCAAVITQWATHEKAVLWDLDAFPTVSLIDPELMLSLPLDVTRDGAVDIMLHALEQSFNGNDKAPGQDRAAEGLVKGVMECLDRVENDPQDLIARESLSWASVAALIGGGGPNFGRSGGFTVHHLEHPLSGYTDISHGRGLALLWVPYLRMILEKRADKIAAMGQALFGVQAGESAAPKTCDAISAWLRGHGFEKGLSAHGVDSQMIQRMADDAVRLSGGGRGFLNAPLPLTPERCAQVYRDAL